MESLRYILILVLLLLLSWALSRWWKKKEGSSLFNASMITLTVLILLELALTGYTKWKYKYWMFQAKHNENSKLFERHPYHVVDNIKHVDIRRNGVRIQHNDVGLRGRSYNEDTSNKTRRIAAIGGSTTYGVGVDNHETWPHILDSLCSEDSIVYNLGVPGHSSVEHLITAALKLDLVQPDVLLLHVGLNDLRVSNVYGLEPDYSNFHAPYLIGSMGMCHLDPLPKISTVYYLARLFQKLGYFPICSYHRAIMTGTASRGLDQKALDLYKGHLRKLMYLCQFHTDKILVIPQILVRENVINGALQWWIPFIDSDQLVGVMKAYNKATQEVSDEMACMYLQEVIDFQWNANDFADPSHLNAKGNLKLAKLIHSKLVLTGDTVSQ